MRFSHLLCFLAGGGLVAAIGLPQPQPPARALPAAQPDPRVSTIAERLDGLEDELQRLDALSSAVAQAERSAAKVPDVVVVEPPKPVPIKDRIRAFALTRDLVHADEALQKWKEIGESTVDPTQRAEAAFERGQIFVKLEDWPAAAAEFALVVELIGLRSVRGQTACYQLGWCEQYGGNHRKAYEALRRLCGSPTLMKAAAPTYRYQLASFARAYDPELAKREFQRFVDEYGDHPGVFAKMVKHAREYLEKNP